MSNTFGRVLSFTTFGESHGAGIGVVIDGFPANIPIDLEKVQEALDRRKPGQSALTTPRTEADKVEVLSGLFEGRSLGTPIALFIKNKDAQSSAYEHLKDLYRPGHADYVYQEKYGIRDFRGGGRSSARETAARVAAGALAQQLLDIRGIENFAYVSTVGHISVPVSYSELDFSLREKTAVRCPHLATAKQMEEYITAIKAEGDSIGGIITGVVKNVPIGLGEPIYDKLQARLSAAMMGINAVKGFEMGLGFSGVALKGSEYNSGFVKNENGKLNLEGNAAGGVHGGISNGEDIYYRVLFKPVASIGKVVSAGNVEGNTELVEIAGRHDPCVLPRAVPIVEAMAALVIADFILINSITIDKF